MQRNFRVGEIICFDDGSMNTLDERGIMRVMSVAQFDNPDVNWEFRYYGRRFYGGTGSAYHGSCRAALPSEIAAYEEMERRRITGCRPAAPALRRLQLNLPWQGTYSTAFAAGPPHRDFAHATLHLVKAVGKIAAAVEPLDHEQPVADHPSAVARALADVVICALRLANVHPEGPIDLEAAIISRLHEKNDLPAEFFNAVD